MGVGTGADQSALARALWGLLLPFLPAALSLQLVETGPWTAVAGEAPWQKAASGAAGCGVGAGGFGVGATAGDGAKAFVMSLM